MEVHRLDCVLEWDGILSDPMSLTVNVTGAGHAVGGSGSFAMPARFVGPAKRSGTSPKVVFHDGTGFDIEVTRFDMRTGIAYFQTLGALEFLVRKRA
ncbi:hypothetical protein [Antarctobacter jejuensis]|uniref:hypothetical protein n=1 Tax=Antarctobacter jejuensis TaxID=1439938 RepID=UPI003FD3B402